MQNDQEQIHFEELAEVLKAANDRRSADLGGWFKELIHRRREEGMARATRSAERPSNQVKA